MRRSVIIILSIVFSVLVLNSAQAQLRLEPVLSFEAGYPLSLERSPGIINRFGTAGSGKSYNYMLGVGGSLIIPFSDAFSFAPTLQYKYSFGGFTSDPYSSAITDSLGSVSTKNYFDVTTTEHRLDLLAPIVFSYSTVSLDLGFWSAVDLSRSIEGKEYILSPDSAHFSGNSKSRIFASGDTIGASHTHYGIEAGMGAKYPISDSRALHLRLYSRMDLAAAADVPSKAFSLGVGLSLAPFVKPTMSIPTSTDTFYSISQSPNKITTAIHFTKNGARVTKQTPIEVTGYNTSYRQYTELPNTITTDNTIGFSGYDLLSSTETKQFSPSDLSRKELSEYDREMLNIIAYRLAHATDAVLDLNYSYVGESGASNKIQLLENYFTDRWGIPAKQIHSKTHKGDTESLTVSSADPTILAPAATQWIERSYTIPHMGIEKSIIAEGGVRRWNVVVTQNEKTIASFSNQSTSESNIADFDLVSDTTSASPLIATIKAEDFSGVTSISHDTLALPSQSDLSRSMIEREAFVFVFLPHKSSTEDNMTDVLLKKLFSVVRSNAKITITEPPSLALAENKKTITEDIISGLKLHPELRTEIKISKRPDFSKSIDPYVGATVVKVEQDK